MERGLKNVQKTQAIGRLGETICAKFYVDQGYALLGMNYRKKYGEIDVIVKKANKVHFIEVKTVSYGTRSDLEYAVTHGTWRPEENVHTFKLKKLARVIEVWQAEHKWHGDVQIDVASIRIVPRETYASVKIIENVIIE